MKRWFFLNFTAGVFVVREMLEGRLPLESATADRAASSSVFAENKFFSEKTSLDPTKFTTTGFPDLRAVARTSAATLAAGGLGRSTMTLAARSGAGRVKPASRV